MIYQLAIIAFCIEFISTTYVSNSAVDLTASSQIRDDIRIEILDGNFNGKNYPNRFLLILNGFELDFVKHIQRGQNAHGIYYVGDDDKLDKHNDQESQFIQEYIEMMGENSLVLIKEEQGNAGQFFRIVGTIELDKTKVDIDIIPIWAQIETRRKRSLKEPVHQKISKDSPMLDKNVHSDYLKIDELEDLRKNLISKKINEKNFLLKSNQPVQLDVEILIVTDSSVYEVHRTFLKTLNQSLIFSYMKIYYSHLINNVNKLFQNSFLNDTDLHINIKASNFLFLTKQSDSIWTDRTLAGDSRVSWYRGKRVIIGSRALDLFKNYTNGIDINFDHAIAFVNNDIWYDTSVSTRYSTRSSATGFSYSNGICSQYKYSIVEDFGAFTNIHTSAHHLARNLGASFDSSSDINCLDDEYYIMSPFLNPLSTKLKYTLSQCSVNELKNILISNGQVSKQAQCLSNGAASLNLVTDRNNLTGLFYSANDQCKMLYGQNASFVQYYSDRMCRQLYCRMTNSNYYVYTSGPAVEGTICDSGKICQNGQCVSSNRIETTECPFEDEPVQNVYSSIRLPSTHVSCSEYFDYLRKEQIPISSFCSSPYSYSCCKSCLPYKVSQVSQCVDQYQFCPYYRRLCSFQIFNVKISDLCPFTCSNCPPVTCPENQSICQNGGSCISRSDSELSCICPEGFSGSVCEKKDPCLPNPCVNGAECYPAGENAFVCQCPTFYIGDDCSLLNLTNSTIPVISTSSTTTLSSTRTTSRTSAQPTSQQQSLSSSTTTETIRSVPGVTNIGRTCMLGRNYSFCDVCGQQFVDPNVRIVGGIDANKNSWPSIGLLVFDYNGLYTFQGVQYRISRQSYCGSTLVDRNTVLTAAHCYTSSIFIQEFGETINLEDDPNFPVNTYKVYLGLHSIEGVFDGTADLTGVTVVPVTKFTMHENYDDNTLDNDIAVLKLARDVAYNSAIQPACLAPNSDYEPSTNTRAWIAGWGTLSSGGSSPRILQNTFITYYYSGSECRNLGSLNFEKQICAGEIQGGRDTCQGDSGGPLYLFDQNKFVQVGITSFGVDCALPGYPGIYTRVAGYLDWIVNNI